jgi:SulP family sulfate permease
MPATWWPKSVTALRGYTARQFLADLQAGLVVGIVAIPLALAFAIASGVPPDRGLVTAAVAGFLISLLGGSRVQIGGPTGAFVVIIYGIVQKHGVDGLVVCTVMAGFLLIVFGLARLGGAIKFIPYPVVTGFTSGIALVIFSSQVKDLLGLRMGPVPTGFLEKWRAFAHSANSASPAALGVSGFALIVLIFWPKLSRRIPGPIVAILLATVGAALLRLPVETIGSRFGEIHAGIPSPHFPALSAERIRELFPSAVTVALLAAIESLLSAVVADGMIGTRHKSNVELVGQGIANVASGLFGGIPATGAIARTATNIKNGGRTPVAGMAHAITVVLAAFLFMKRMADVTNVGMITSELTDAPDGTMNSDADGVARRRIPTGVEVYEVNGPFFFGAADKIRDVLGVTSKKPRVFILRMRNVPAMDASGMRVLDDLHDSFTRKGIRFLIAGINAQPLMALDRAGRLDRYGRENFVADLDEALARARETVESQDRAAS